MYCLVFAVVFCSDCGF